MSTSDKLRTALSADWLERLEAGDDKAVSELVGIVYQQLVGFARKKLIGMPPQVADDEGAVISALRSFFSGVQNGQFPEMQDENDLWRVLATITARKAIRQLRVHWKQSGEAGRVKRNADIDHLVSRFSSPEDNAITMDEFECRLDDLDDPLLKKIALMRLEGLETSDIADQLSIHIRSIQRKLKLIESKWLESD